MNCELLPVEDFHDGIRPSGSRAGAPKQTYNICFEAAFATLNRENAEYARKEGKENEIAYLCP